MVDSHMVSANESFGYGTQVCLDGASADPGAIANVEGARRFVSELVSAVENTCHDLTDASVVTVDAGPDGYSLALVAGETSATLHVFLELRGVALQLFSPITSPPATSRTSSWPPSASAATRAACAAGG